MNQNEDQILRYTCPKCGNKQYETGEIWASSNFFTKTIGISSRRFTFLTCQKCKYTELYRVSKKEIGEVINFLAK